MLIASLLQSLPLYLVGFVMLFAFSGIGNGSIYKMIPAIFKAKSGTRSSTAPTRRSSMAKSQRHAGALIGLAGAIGAFGGVLVNLAFRQSFLATKSADSAYIAFIAFYAVCFAVTWYVYIRESRASSKASERCRMPRNCRCCRCTCPWPAAAWWWSAGDRWRPGRSRPAWRPEQTCWWWRPTPASRSSPSGRRRVVEWSERDYLAGDLDGGWLAFAATGDRCTDRRWRRHAPPSAPFASGPMTPAAGTARARP